jgi:hypothetical protein
VPGLVPSAGVNLIRFYGFGRTDLSLRIAAKTTTKAPRQEGAIYLVGAVNGNIDRVDTEAGDQGSPGKFSGRLLV